MNTLWNMMTKYEKWNMKYIYQIYCTYYTLKTFSAEFLNAVYFRWGLANMCTIRLTNDLIDSGQPRAKSHLYKGKTNYQVL